MSNQDEFRNFLRQMILKHYILRADTEILQNNASLILKIWITDLFPLKPILLDCYANRPRGTPPRDPVAMLRSLLVMDERREESITEWVKELRSTPLFAILSGFEPYDTPGVGTFYDFIHRLRPEEHQKRRKILLPFKSKPREKKKANEKLPPPHSGILKRLKDRILKGQDQPLHKSPQHTLQTLFKEGFVLPSASKRLLGDTSNLSVSGDGTIIESGGNHHGIKVCKCKSKGIYRCHCKRRFSDPEASWGWDSYRERYVYGRSHYEITASDSPHDLPIHLKLANAQRHDSVLGMATLNEARKLYPEFAIKKYQGDSAHDNYPFYELLDAWRIEAFIPLNERNKNHNSYELPVKKNEIPFCQANLPMIPWGYCPDRYRIKYRCPQKTGKVESCPLSFPCSPSSYGRVVYLKSPSDLRLFPKTPRESKNWKTEYSKRTSSERSIKRKKFDYHIENSRVRSTGHWYVRVYLAAMCQHIDAWYIHSETDAKSFVKGWIQEAVRAP